jgi:hypothetical protein
MPLMSNVSVSRIMPQNQTADEGRPMPKLPVWITYHFRRSIDSQELLMQIIDISERGISVHRGMPKAIEALAKAEGTEDESTIAKKLARAESETALSSTEVAQDFPVLHGLAVVALWSWLEHFVKGFLALSQPPLDRSTSIGQQLRLSRAVSFSSKRPLRSRP